MAFLGAVAEHVEHHAPNRVCRVVAVMQEVAVRGESDLALVHAVRLDELAKRGLGNVEPANGVLERDDDGVRRMAAVGLYERLLPLVELSQPVARGLVAEVVGLAAEGVDRVEVGPHAARQQQRADREVLVVGLRQAFAVGVRLVKAGRLADGAIRCHACSGEGQGPRPRECRTDEETVQACEAGSPLFTTLAH